LEEPSPGGTGDWADCLRKGEFINMTWRARSRHANAYFGLRSTGNTGRSLAPDLGRDDLSGPLDADILVLDEAVAGFDGRMGGASLSESEESDVELDDEDDEEDEEDDDAEEEDVEEEEVEESESESDSLSSSDCLRDGPADWIAILAMTTGG
jgi:hypothetical protein